MADNKSLIGTKNKKGQTFTDTWTMMNDAPRTPSFYTGSEVIKEALRRASCDVMIAYPITPQSEAAALIGELFAEGYIGDYFRGESEFAVMSQCGPVRGCRFR
jgi:pyruvate ferredoxin oxidoreductase alpha subunit